MNPGAEKNHNSVINLTDQRNKKISTVTYFDESIDNKILHSNRILQTLTFIEDRSFEKHIGLSFKGLSRALYKNLKQRRISQGGSTITQQLIRTLIPIKNRYFRKFIEITLAPICTLFWGRNKIFQLYTNRVFFGIRLHGLNAAACAFFKKKVEHINETESIFLFSLLSRPNFWIRHPESLARKVNRIFKERYGKNIKSSESVRLARTISKNAQEINKFPPWFPKFGSYISNINLSNHSGKTPIDMDLQKFLYKKTRATNQNVCFGVINYKTFQIRSIVDFLDINETSYPAIFSNFIEVGSLLKPLLAILSIRKGYEPSKLFFDSKPIVLKFDGFADWEVRNHQQHYHGNMSLLDGIAKSDNSVCAQALHYLGLEDFCTILREHQIISNNSRTTPAIVLGACADGFNFLNVLRFYSKVAALKNHTRSPFDRISPKSQNLTIYNELIAARKCLKEVVTNGTGKKLLPYKIIGAKTGTSGNYKTLICYDREQLYFTIHKEKVDSILQEQYLEEIFKSYGAVAFTVSIFKDLKRFFTGMTNPNELYGKNRWTA